MLSEKHALFTLKSDVTIYPPVSSRFIYLLNNNQTFVADMNASVAESMMRFFKSQPFWPQVEPYFQMSQIVQRWINDLSSRLKLHPDMSLNIGDLFPNATMLNEYLQASLALDEETTLQLISGIILKPGKVSGSL